MDRLDEMSILSEGELLPISADWFARWAPGNDPVGAARHWLIANGVDYLEAQGGFLVTKATVRLFEKDWQR